MCRLSAASASSTFHIMSCYTVNLWLTVPASVAVQWEARLTEKTQHPVSFGQKFAEIFEEENSVQFNCIHITPNHKNKELYIVREGRHNNMEKNPQIK